MTNWEAVLADLVAKRTELAAKRDLLDKAIDALLYLYGRGILPVQTSSPTKQPEACADQVRSERTAGKTIREACIEIAVQNGGYISVSEALPVLITKAPNSSWSSINMILKRAADFEKSGPGQYRLKEKAPNDL